MKLKPKATLHDVAAAAGVSIATASKALNNVSVSPENKERVIKAAARMGYVVNETARALRNKRSHTIGVIFSELSTTRGLGLLDAMSGSLEAAGYSLICATARGNAEAYDLLMHRFLERRVDGLLCVMPPAQLPSVRRYQSTGIPIVAINQRSKAMLTQPLVHASMDLAARAALADIVKLGHRRVLSMDDGSGTLSLAANAHWPIAVQQVSLAGVGGLDQFVDRVLKQAQRPTLISAHAAQAEGILAVCKVSGVQVPNDLSLIAITQSATEQRAEALGLSSLLIRPELLGEGAAAQMMSLLAGKPAPKDVSVEVGDWTLRGSVGKAHG